MTKEERNAKFAEMRKSSKESNVEQESPALERLPNGRFKNEFWMPTENEYLPDEKERFHKIQGAMMSFAYYQKCTDENHLCNAFANTRHLSNGKKLFEGCYVKYDPKRNLYVLIKTDAQIIKDGGRSSLREFYDNFMAEKLAKRKLLEEGVF